MAPPPCELRSDSLASCNPDARSFLPSNLWKESVMCSSIFDRYNTDHVVLFLARCPHWSEPF